jgi:glycosyltransferase involved in cell wall biosynthesis
MKRPLISCLMATGRRRRFLPQAIKYWSQQTYPEKELVIVDDDPQDSSDLIPHDPRIQYIRVHDGMTLAQKLNNGMEYTKGSFVQKLDDDDYYAPNFMVEMADVAIPQMGEQGVIGLVNCFVVLVLPTGQFKFSGYNFLPGASVFFSQNVWEKCPFDESVPPGHDGTDWRFIKGDHSAKIAVVYGKPELLMVVRGHGMGHLWKTSFGGPTEELFVHKNDHVKTLEQYLPAEHLLFYRELIKEKCPNFQ